MAITTTHRVSSRTRQNRPLEEYYAQKKKRDMNWGEVHVGQFALTMKHVLLYTLVLVGIIAALVGVGHYQANLTVKNVAIGITSEEKGSFLVEEDVRKVLAGMEERSYEGELMGSVDLNMMEGRLLDDPTVLDAQVHKNFRGNIFVDVELRKPIAKLVNNNGSFVYLDENGWKFPGSKRYSSDVLLVRGDFDEMTMPQDSFYCDAVDISFPVFEFIKNDPFWNSMISEVFIHQDGSLMLFPQVGNARVEFGLPVRIEEKFNNLKQFYLQVSGKVGWDRYKEISVKYKGQIKATRR